MADIKFDIIEKLGTIGEGSKGWSKEVNIISWNGRKPKVDIRDWDENNEKMGKGLTLLFYYIFSFIFRNLSIIDILMTYYFFKIVKILFLLSFLFIFLFSNFSKKLFIKVLK